MQIPNRMHKPAPMPVIVGAPRSGTTLLRLMLDAHPDLAIPPETGFFSALPGPDGRCECTADWFMDFITNFPPSAPAWADFDVSQGALRECVEALHPFDLADAFRCFYRLYAEQHSKPRWGDKTPTHALHIAAIARLLPEARIIHLIRDGRDAALSVRPLWFAPAQDFAGLAAHWQHIVRTARSQAQECPHYREVRYENLIREPERELTALCEYLDLPFDSAMLAYHERAAERLQEHRDRTSADGTLIVTNETRRRAHELTSHPPDVTRIGVWRSQMPPEAQHDFLAFAGDLLRELGYAD